MRRAIALVLAGLLVTVSAASTAAAQKKKKTVRESYDVQALPYPVTGAVNEGLGCAGGIEGVHKDTFPFTAPGTGILDVTLSEFIHDWDLHVLAEDGTILAQSNGDFTVTVERIVIPLKTKSEVGVVACNYRGGPDAHVDLKFTY
ncbi:MAG: hypothetical protein ABR505_00255 [Actinomycetota bacterium]